MSMQLEVVKKNSEVVFGALFPFGPYLFYSGLHFLFTAREGWFLIFSCLKPDHFYDHVYWATCFHFIKFRSTNSREFLEIAILLRRCAVIHFCGGQKITFPL